MKALPSLIVTAAAILCTAAAQAAPRTLHWVERPTNEHEIDVAPKGDSAGDLLVFFNPLFDEANAKQVGTTSGSCMRTEPGKAYECAWTMHLEKGQLTIAGTDWDKGESELVVLGGTGIYAGARGTLRLVPREGHTLYDFIVTLL
jgi:allene oxide cyclase